MAWGLQMAISEDHSAFPAHAHLNLLGFVALFLFGLYYRLHPATEASRLALPQVLTWILATAIIAVGVGLINAGHASAEPIAAAGSLLAFADALLFTWLVFREQGSDQQQATLARS
jgi:hypothetical protein